MSRPIHFNNDRVDITSLRGIDRIAAQLGLARNASRLVMTPVERGRITAMAEDDYGNDVDIPSMSDAELHDAIKCHSRTLSTATAMCSKTRRRSVGARRRQHDGG